MSRDNRAVLLVDDDRDLVQLLSMRLESVGYRVEAAHSGEQALAKIAVTRPLALITDLRMEGMDGMALFQLVHDQDPSLPVIMLTAHGTIPDAVQATQQGVFGYLTKPFEDRELLDLLERAVAIRPEEPVAEAGGDDAWRAEIITANPAMEALLAEVQMVAASDTSVLLQGASGSGKEVFARAIHLASRRHDRPFVAVNCAAIPEPLLESELFGHAKGAFTGAVSTHDGLFQTARGGTVFLDEVGDMPVALQAKLLRVLQDREVRPVGATQVIPVDVRIISATHNDLVQAVTDGTFREDLYYRLNVVTLTIPPLRERREDIPLLAHHFLKTLREKHKHRAKQFSPEAMEMLITHDWPGNVRHLLNVVEQCCVLCTSALIPASLVARALREKPTEILSFADAKKRFERDYLVRLLKITNGRVTEAARIAGRNRSEFYRLLQRHHLTAAMFKRND